LTCHRNNKVSTGWKNRVSRDYTKQDQAYNQYPLAGVTGPRLAAGEAGACLLIQKVSIYKGKNKTKSTQQISVGCTENTWPIGEPYPARPSAGGVCCTADIGGPRGGSFVPEPLADEPMMKLLQSPNLGLYVSSILQT
jgi:hypothetical protein